MQSQKSLIICTEYDSKTPVLSLSSAGGTPKIVKTDSANGVAEIRLLPADTSYTPSSGVKVTGDSFVGVYDIEIADGGTVSRAFEGACTITREVTRP